jgi:glycerol-3-phosphate dehydrogenase subunit B
MSRRVVVIGGGASGTAAAYAAARLGARVTVIIGRPGATSFSSGALDGDVGVAVDEARAFVDALGIWEIGGCRLVTSAGLLRSARGHDLSVLDLQGTEPGVVGVIDVLRRGWDAKGLAEAWTSEPWAIERGLRFEPVAVEALQRSDEDLIPLVDLAARHDEPARVSWLGDRLRESALLRDKRAVVMGPWLGLGAGVATELSRALGKPVGEPLSAPGGAAGWRFERARDALLAKTGIERVDDWATAVRADQTGARIELASGSGVTADAVVMALGGLAGGGIEWSPASAVSGFKTSLDHPASLALRGRPLAPSGSLEGALFEKFSWRGESASTGIERVGIWTDGEGHVRPADGTQVPWLYGAGDAVADAPRTMIDAIRSGLWAGARASR